MCEKSCASSNRATSWNEIDFTIAKASVKKLQRRIYAACGQNDIGKIKTLTCLMLHSFYAKALAVHHVCSKHGKNTPGIDDVLWLTDKDKFDAIYSLRPRGYKAKPLKRAYINKSDGRSRPLGIPTMKDRAMQTLYRFALEPIAEFYADEHSYGFRPKRNVSDAVSQIIKCMSDNPKREWILKTDIASCFDNISHDWLMENIPMDKIILKKFLKAGYIEHNIWHPSDKGAPQGGCISSMLCNLTLDKLEDVICMKFNDNVDVIRYADDLTLISDDQMLLVQEVIPVIENFLSERGLYLSKEKTYSTNIKSGIVFLGWKVFKHNDLIISIPSEKAVNSLFEKITITISNYKTEKERVYRLKSIIKGWLNFYCMATPPFLLGMEFNTVMLINQLTGNRYLAEYVGNLFSKYISI